MASITLSKNEEVLFKSGDKKIYITSKRIRKYTRTGKKPSFTSIMLDDIDAIKMHYSSSIWAVQVAGLALLAGLISLQSSVPGLSPALFFIAFFAVGYYT